MIQRDMGTSKDECLYCFCVMHLEAGLPSTGQGDGVCGNLTDLEFEFGS